MDSPPSSSGYVPVSLSDTLTSQRTYRSTKTAPSSSSSAGLPSSTSHSTLPRPHGPRPSHATGASSYNAKERQEAARREAAAMMASLGIEETPRPARSLNSAAGGPGAAQAGGGASAVELASLRAQLADKEDEIASLRREVGVLQREKKELAGKNAALEKEKRERGDAGAGLDVRQLEELERQFESQEQLLAGYQKEAERSMQELDALRNRQRRLTDFLERTYGADWADDLGLTDKPRAGSSPIVRTKLAARASLANTGTPTGLPPLSRLNSDASLLTSSSVFETPSHSSSSISSAALPDEPSSPSQAHSPSPATTTLSPSLPTGPSFPASASLTLDPSAATALKAHLDSVQALLRSMESRLIARDVELAAVEKRAREEKELAGGKVSGLEETVRRLQEQLAGGA
ncbi:hypothetical protein JCM8097_000576 [Rhodosporidiobolus ruineniae]